MPFYITDKTKEVIGRPDPVPVVEGLGKWQAQGIHPDGRFVYWSEKKLDGEEVVTEWPNGVKMVEGECTNEIHDGEPEADPEVVKQMIENAARSAIESGDLSLGDDGDLKLKADVLGIDRLG